MKKIILILGVLILACSSVIAAQGIENQFAPNPLSYYSGDISNYWPSYGKEECTARQDFIIQILPGGCSPAVVRSDLLEEQNVPVFCQLTGIKINPLINVPEITSITFKGKELPKDIGGIGFHPARAALKTWGSELLGSPVVNNFGYLVVMLKRQPLEKNMSKSVEAELTAVIQYKAEKAFGIGKASFVSGQIDKPEDWHQNYQQYGFWKGKGYVRVKEIGSDDKGQYAMIDIMLDETKILTSLRLREGETSKDIYLPGYYCQAALRVTLQDVTSEPKAKVKLNINGEEMWVGEGQRIIDDKCSVSKIEQDLYGSGSVEVRCPDGLHKISLNPAKAKLQFKSNNVEFDSVYSVKDTLDNGVLVAFIGDTSKAKDERVKNLNKQFIVLARPKENVFMDTNYYESIVFKTRKLLEGTKFKGSGKFSEQNFLSIISFITGTTGSTDLTKNVNEELGDKAFKIELAEKLTKQFGNKIDFAVVLNGESMDKVKLALMQIQDFKFEGLESLYEREYKGDSGDAMEDYYKKAIEEYRKIQINYGSEKKDNTEEDNYGAQALDKAATLAGELKKFKTQGELLTEIIEKYPNSKAAESAKIKVQQLKGNDMTDAVTTAIIETEPYTITLEEVKDVSLGDKSTKLIVFGTEDKTSREGLYAVGDIIKAGITIKQIYEDYIEIDAPGSALTKSTIKKGETATISYKTTKDDKTTTESVTIRVSEINLVKEARIILAPLVERAETQTNFTFKIGIEKRSIQLSPEKTNEMINKLNDSIAQWEKLTNDLGNLVKTWTGTCYAGSAFLIGKSFFENLNGGSVARRTVMRGPNGWWTRCAEMVDKDPEKYNKDVHRCLAQNNGLIETETGVVQKYVGQINSEIGAITGTPEEIRKARIEAFKKKCQNFGTTIGPLGEGTTKLTGAELDDICNKLDKSDIFSQDLSDLDLWTRIYNDPAAQKDTELQKAAKGHIQQIMQPLKDDIAYTESKDSLTNAISNKGLGWVASSLGFPKDYQTQKTSMWAESETSLKEKIKESADPKNAIVYDTDKNKQKGVILAPFVIPPIADEGLLDYSNKKALVTFTDNGMNHYSAKEMFIIESSADGIEIKEKVDPKKMNKLLGEQLRIKDFERITPEACGNTYSNPEVRYHDKEPYKGQAALVPLDKEGWYAATKPAGIGMGAFKESGELTTFSLCKTGPNGREEFFSSERDDICEVYFLDQSSTLPPHACIGPGDISTGKLTNLVTRARQFFNSAANQYKSGVTSVSLPGFGNVPVKSAPVLNPGIECEDFMSPSDCNLMFNLCDPVLCPSSRCDFGGRYAVPNVVQTGIIGGIMLCLPNFGMPQDGGVLVPLCLTGIHAGMENLVMIMKAARECLQENLKTGKTIGICDEITSVYLCDFFWKQAIPLIKIGVPQLLQAVFEGNKRGGGEYMLVQDAWSNLDQSVNYFTNYYGANAFKAFQMRSTEQVGSEVCKAFVSVRYPTSKKLLDQLLEPESPTQFYAKFSEDVMTEATVPATSHYKVYVWIYAGKDKGVYYNVYLRNPPASAYYQQMGEIQVPGAVGFIPTGQRVDKAVDFTAPAGYKELCVRIDSQEKCGFTQVTTDFAMDELKNLYLEEQVKADVTKEEECISGTSSLMPLASLNIQEGVEEATNPAIYKHGIIRVCATDDPGKLAEPGRWRPVGYCTDRNVKCWLDTTSVNQSISDTGIAERALDEAKDKINTLDQNGYYDKEQTEKAIQDTNVKKDKAMKEIDDIIAGSTQDTARQMKVQIDTKIEPLITEYRDIMSKSLLNSKKGETNFKIAAVYHDLTKSLFAKFFEKTDQQKAEEDKKAAEQKATEQGIIMDKLIKNIQFGKKGEETYVLVGKEWRLATDDEKKIYDAEITKEEIPITAATMLIYYPPSNPEEAMKLAQLVEYLRLGSIDWSTSGQGFTQWPSYSGTMNQQVIGEIIKVNNLKIDTNNKDELNELFFGVITQVFKIPLTSKQNKIISELPKSCSEFEKDTSFGYKFSKFVSNSNDDMDIEARRCRDIKMTISQTSNSKGNGIYELNSVKCAYDVKLRKCDEESKVKTPTKDAAAVEQAKASFSSFVSQFEDCKNKELTADEKKFGGCICDFDSSQLKVLNSPDLSHSTYYAIELSSNKIALKSGGSGLYEAGGGLIPALGSGLGNEIDSKQISYKPCLIHTKRIATTTSVTSLEDSSQIIRKTSFALIPPTTSPFVADGIKIKSPGISSWPTGNDIDLLKLDSGEICIVTEYSKKNIDSYNKFPRCSGEKKKT